MKYFLKMLFAPIQVILIFGGFGLTVTGWILFPMLCFKLLPAADGWNVIIGLVAWWVYVSAFLSLTGDK